MPARSFGNPVPGHIAPNSAAPDPPNFRCTRPFGDGSVPEFGLHDGLDIGNGRSGDPILAMDAGTVTHAYTDPSGAMIVRIQHDDGWSTGYAHMDALYVKAGDRVSKGEKIARLDNTGHSSGAHLHMDTTSGSSGGNGGQRKDPWPLLAQNQSTQEAEPMPQFGPFEDGDYERITNAKYVTLPGANFREQPTTDAQILKTFEAGETVIPHARCKGPTTEPVDDRVWWYLVYKYAKGAQREGAFHISAIDHVGELVEGDPDLAAAEKAAADAVRDAGRKALDTEAAKYGA